MYDSPIEWCPVARAYVELDESQVQCAEQHGCSAAECPLARYFLSAELIASRRQNLPESH